jgi:small conductance mechanosensitive channel
MLLWLRPFRIGDFIEVGAIAGTVREMGLFACHLETFDGMFLFAPNSAIWNNPLKNHTSNAGRLVSIDVTVSSNADIARARDILVAMAERDTRVLNVPPARLRRKPRSALVPAAFGVERAVRAVGVTG